MTSENENLTKIKHLVLSGGCVWGLNIVGMLIEAIDQHFVDMKEIETIWASSIGALIGVIMSLKIDPATIRDYVVKRPWETVCKQNRHSVLEIYDGKGIIHRGFFENILEPLLTSVDLSCKTTLLQLYEYNGIEIHIYATEINEYKLMDFSFKTHPDWTVVDAIYASCCIPIIFVPLIRDGNCFIDGGLMLNYPISECVKQIGNLDEIFGISLGNMSDSLSSNIHEKSSILDVLTSVLNGVVCHHSLFGNDNSYPITYQIVLKTQTTFEYGAKVLYDKSERELLVEQGKKEMAHHLSKWFSIPNSQIESDSVL